MRGAKMIDIHCHILPGIDDGAKTSRDTLTMLKSAIDEGITTITATPHHDPQFNNESPLILKKVKEVQNIIDEHQLSEFPRAGRSHPQRPGPREPVPDRPRDDLLLRLALLPQLPRRRPDREHEQARLHDD